MKIFTRSLATLFISATVLSPQIVRAQPQEVPPPVEAPAPLPDRNAAAEKAMQEMMDKFKAMTPDQMRDYMRDMQENMLRSQITQQGFNDLELQEIVVNFLRQQDASRDELRAVAARLRNALGDKNTPTEQFAPLLAELQKAAAAQQVRREQASAELEQTLKLDEQPRVEAMLHLNGFIGDELWSLGDLSIGIGAVNSLPVPDTNQHELDEALEKGAAMGREIGEKIARLTPAQLRDYLREIQEKNWRETLTRYNFSDLKTQNLIIEWLHEQDQARREIRLVSARLRDSIANIDTDGFKLLQLMSRWQNLAENESARRSEASAQLSQDLNLAANPRLNALLHLYGIVGDEAWHFGSALTNSFTAVILPTPAEIKALPAK